MYSYRDALLALSVEHETFGLQVSSLSPTLVWRLLKRGRERKTCSYRMNI